MLDSASVLERRRQLLRFVLLGIIVLTIPFYCIGFFLWGTAPQLAPATQQATQGPTNTPLGGERTLTVIATSTIPLFGTSTQVLFPTPGQFFTPFPTAVQPATFVYLTPTLAPTLTVAPSSTPVPTNTEVQPSLVPPTNTPQPTNTTVPPTNTDIPATNTDIPTATDSFIPPPSDTPNP
jgi:serine/threonine-protein kinase